MINIAYAMGQGGAGGAGAGGFSAFVPLILMFVIFYFLLIRPQQKRQKQTQAMIGSLRNGDKVVTSAGIYGTIAGIKDDVIILKIADNVKVEILKSAVSGLVNKGS